jgi:hypothetical protein
MISRKAIDNGMFASRIETLIQMIPASPAVPRCIAFCLRSLELWARELCSSSWQDDSKAREGWVGIAEESDGEYASLRLRREVGLIRARSSDPWNHFVAFVFRMTRCAQEALSGRVEEWKE